MIAHGYDMASLHSGGMSVDVERALVARTLDTLNSALHFPVNGWLSPGKSQSANTPELLAEAGLTYVCDWPNDELPYEFRTANGPLVEMPHSADLDDRQIIIDYKHDEGSFCDQVMDHYAYLSREAASAGGRIMSLNLHPWVIGQSHRISTLEKVLGFLAEKGDIWSASGSQIIDAWHASNDEST